MAIDLDAARAARQEQEKKRKAPVLIYGGEKWALPREIPLETILAVSHIQKRIEEEDNVGAGQAFREVAQSLLGPAAERFLALQPSVQDIAALVAGLTDEYGLSPGESQASQTS